MMVRSSKQLVLGGFLAVGLVAAIGCEKHYTRPPIDTSAILGSWIEIVQQGKPSPRVRAREPQAYVRYITLNEDKTFEFTLRTRDGKPTKYKAEGTWAIEENTLKFKVTSSTFAEKDERRNWVPESSLGIHKRDVGAEGRIDALPIADLEETVVDYKRAP
jgi:hypothetical protein